MYDWIIEADIYRLNKAARETDSPRERRKLEMQVERKALALAATRGHDSGQERV
jgi:hypothetical protein